MSDTKQAGSSEPLYDRLVRECDVMVRHALGRGASVPPTVVTLVASALGEIGTKPGIAELTRAHRKLALIVAPAEPRPLRLMHELEMQHPSRVWFHMSLPRSLTLVAIASIVVSLGVGMSPDISTDPDAGNPLLSSGWTLLLNQLFFLSIASLGSCFHGLFTVKRFIMAGTYDPSYSPTYWIRFLLGIMSGLILASLIDVNPSNNLHAVARPLLALIGGFSAAVVHRALERLVATVDGLLQGDARQLLADEKRVLLAEGEQRIRETKLDTAHALLEIQQQLRDDPDKAREAIAKLTLRLVPRDELELSTAPEDAEPAQLGSHGTGP